MDGQRFFRSALAASKPGRTQIENGDRCFTRDLNGRGPCFPRFARRR